MRILVTGHTGFVGGAIARRLLAAGEQVVGLARTSAGLSGLAKELAVDLGAPEGLADLAGLIGGCDAVVHCAACVSYDDAEEQISLVNCLGTQRLIALAQATGIGRFVFISGVTVIGRPRTTPIDEQHPTEPSSAYLASKLYGEHLLTTACSDRFSGINLRLTAPVGPDMPSSRMLRVFAESASQGSPLLVLGRGSRKQNYVHVDDVAAAVESALGEQTSSGTFNVAGPTTISNLQAAELCVERARSSSDISLRGIDPEEEVEWDVSTAAAEEALGYRPRRDLAETIDSLLAGAPD